MSRVRAEPYRPHVDDVLSVYDRLESWPGQRATEPALVDWILQNLSGPSTYGEAVALIEYTAYICGSIWSPTTPGHRYTPKVWIFDDGTP